MGMAVNPGGDRAWAPFVIGATLGFAVMAMGPLTGAGLNPARAFGPALVGDAFGGGGTFLFVYVLGPIAGALLAGVGYTALVIGPQDRGTDREGRVVPHPGTGERPIDKLD
jgi:glycerol uptake facilitator protein